MVRIICPQILPPATVTFHATYRMPDGASYLVQAVSVWSVKIRRALSWHCWDSSVGGHTTTIMRDMVPPCYGSRLLDMRDSLRLADAVLDARIGMLSRTLCFSGELPLISWIIHERVSPRASTGCVLTQEGTTIQKGVFLRE